MPESKLPLLLVVDDDPDFLEIISKKLIKGGFSVIQARDGDQALEILKTQAPDLVILDVLMKPKSGVEVAQEIVSRGIKVDFVFLTNAGDPDVSGSTVDEKFAKEIHALAFFRKLDNLDSLIEKIKDLINQRSTHNGSGP